MEIIQRKSAKYIGERILICCLFLLFFTAPNQTVAQSTTPDSSTSTSASSDGGPSLDNVKKFLPQGDEENKRLQEEAKHDEFMSYIYMGLGFSVVIAIAWFTTSLAKKRRIKEDEMRAQRAQMMQHQHPHRKPRR